MRRQPCALVAIGYSAKKSGGPLRQIVRTGLVCLCCDALYSRGPQSINARSVWAQTRHNSRESIGIMYAVRIVVDFVLACLVTWPPLANSACAVNLLEESGTLVSQEPIQLLQHGVD